MSLIKRLIGVARIIIRLYAGAGAVQCCAQRTPHVRFRVERFSRTMAVRSIMWRPRGAWKNIGRVREIAGVFPRGEKRNYYFRTRRGAAVPEFSRRFMSDIAPRTFSPAPSRAEHLRWTVSFSTARSSARLAGPPRERASSIAAIDWRDLAKPLWREWNCALTSISELLAILRKSSSIPRRIRGRKGISILVPRWRGADGRKRLSGTVMDCTGRMYHLHCFRSPKVSTNTSHSIDSHSSLPARLCSRAR